MIQTAFFAPIRRERKKMDAHVISLANQKGGTAKTTTCANLGI